MLTNKNLLFKKHLALITCIVLIGCSQISIAQEKLEREFRVDEQEVPTNAVQALSQVVTKKPFNWYKETGLEYTTYEAKGRLNGKIASIEFNSDGILEDVEINERWRSLPQALRTNITTILEKDSDRFKIKKVQAQYLNNEQPLATIISQIEKGALKPNYELVVQLKVDGLYLLYEYLFTNDGTFIQRLEIVERNSFNIQF